MPTRDPPSGPILLPIRSSKSAAGFGRANGGADGDYVEEPSLFGSGPRPTSQPNSDGHRYVIHSSMGLGGSPESPSFAFSTTQWYTRTALDSFASLVARVAGYLYLLTRRPFDARKHSDGELGHPFPEDGDSEKAIAVASSDHSSQAMRVRRLSQSALRTPDGELLSMDQQSDSKNLYSERSRLDQWSGVPGHPDKNGIWTCSCPGHFV